MEDVPYSDLRAKTAPTTRSFGAALKKPGTRFIMECKKASPSEGLIRKNFDIDEIAGVYSRFADAVSVLTDEPYFQGSLGVLRRARGLLDRPILAKDFVFHPYQVCEARFHGADAALLILSVLDDAAYRACADEAERLSMDVLTEVHDDAEMSRALALGAKIIGVNNRNLKTLGVDTDLCARLAARVPSDRLLVCESGVKSHEDVLRLRSAARVFLVGGALMKAERLDLAARRLVYGGVKVCGLTSPEDAVAAYEAGAVFGGVIFAPSPRRVDEATAQSITTASPLPMVGVFVNEAPESAARLAAYLGLTAVQLYGGGQSSPCGAADDRYDCEVWEAFRVRDKLPPSMDGCGRVLLDSEKSGAGKSFAWSLVSGLADKLGTSVLSRVILAGGINEGNAREAAALGCYAIDVNSGVESAPGVKDHVKIRRLFDTLRNF